MPIILAADTSTATNSVAICRDNVTLVESVVEGGRRHSERLIPTIDWLLGEAGLTLSGIDMLAISIGPGSFTGLRIGAATWKGLALANDLPLIGVSTLDAMTRLSAFAPTGYLAVALDARMKEVFAAVYRFEDGERHRVVEPCACSPESLMTRIESLPGFSQSALGLVGDGASLYRDTFLAQWPNATIADPFLGVPRASAVAQEALGLRAAGVSEDGAQVEPVYLRKSQAEVNRDKKLASADA
jgi:tRNA threonylcarbamoyladenosine biosynthesis protein TsaB